MTKEEHIKEIERIILFNDSAGKNGSVNLPEIEKVSDYKSKVRDIDYHYYIERADMHYFVSRQLFVHFLGEYSYFSAQQCVEN